MNIGAIQSVIAVGLKELPHTTKNMFRMPEADVFVRQTRHIAPTNGEELLTEVDAVRKEAATVLGIDVEKVPPIQIDHENILPKEAVAAHMPVLNEFFCNPHLMIAHPDLFPVDEFATHEACVHGYLANTRSAWDHQFPKEVQAESSNIISQLVKEGESGEVVYDLKTAIPKPGSLIPNIKKAIPAHAALNVQDQDKIYHFMEQAIWFHQELVEKAHKYATPFLSKVGKENLESLLHTFTGVTADREAFNAELSAYIEQHIPALEKIRRQKIIDIMNQDRKFLTVQAPNFSRSERQKVAEVVKEILDQQDKYVEIISPTQFMETGKVRLPKLNKEGRQLVKSLMESLPEFSEQFEKDKQSRAFADLTHYINAQVLRSYLLRQAALIPKNERLLSILKPLTPEELEQARRSFRGYISTLEGNLHVARSQTEENIFNYTLGAWEELLARRTVADFRLKKVQHDLVSLSDPAAIRKAKVQEEKFKNDLTLIDLSEEYVHVRRQMGQLERDPQAIRKIESLKKQLRSLKKELYPLEKARSALSDSVSYDDYIGHTRESIGFDGEIHQYTYLEHPNEDQLIEMEKPISEINKKQSAIRKQIEELAGTQSETASERLNELLQERDRLLEKIRPIAHKGTIHPLPRQFFESDQAYAEYHAPITNVVIETMTAGRANSLMENLFGGRDLKTTIQGVFDKKVPD